MGGALRVALLGCGTVGSEVARLLTTHADDLAARVGSPLELAGIAVRRISRDRGDLPVELFTTDAATLAARDDVDIVVEVIGGIEPARSLILGALEAGASVVTANKALLAEDGATLFDAADKHGVDLYYEAAVAGAIPILRPLRESLAGDRVRRVLGIVNGTTNYSTSRSTSSARPPRRHWAIAECSESTATSCPGAAAASTSAPPATRDSLLAKASRAPVASARSVGSSPREPVMPLSTMSAGVPSIRSFTASGPARMRGIRNSPRS